MYKVLVGFIDMETKDDYNTGDLIPGDHKRMSAFTDACVVRALTVDEIKAELDKRGIPYKANTKREALAKLLRGGEDGDPGVTTDS